MSEKQISITRNIGLDDTDTQAYAMLLERLSKMTPTERIKRFFLLFETARAFTVAGLRSRYPHCTEEELHRRKAAHFLGREYAIKHYDWDPELKGY